jgi:hypothetical protein
MQYIGAKLTVKYRNYIDSANNTTIYEFLCSPNSVFQSFLFYGGDKKKGGGRGGPPPYCSNENKRSRL